MTPRVRISIASSIRGGIASGAAGISRAALAAAAKRFAELSGKRVALVFRAVAVVLQDDAQSALAHEAVMGASGATDVITQRLDPIPPEPPGIYGELYVNIEMAVRMGAETARRHKGWNARKELLLYIAHGMDHLSGADDATPRERAAMRRRELGWLKEIEQE